MLRHVEEIYQFLLTKQKLIPMPKWCVDVDEAGDHNENEVEGDRGLDNHQTRWIDKLTDDMIYLEDACSHLSD